MYTVIQQTETGESFGVQNFHSYTAAATWIEANESNYPESSFLIEGPNA